MIGTLLSTKYTKKNILHQNSQAFKEDRKLSNYNMIICTKSTM